ncbi:MAG TPA: hypothetical protein VKA10_03630, partial [Prolixibacteraceae bacterium]|nr:hypothetical protein [Prolixibacteraceae bacterium]
IMCGTYAQNPTLLPTSKMQDFIPPEKKIRRISQALEGGHEQDWIRACKEAPERRLAPSSNFDYAAPLNEMVLLGVLATRLQSLQRKLIWDGPNMRFTNISTGDTLKILAEENFKIENGDPQFNKKYVTLPANEMADEWIRHTYRQGWEQI